MDEKLSLLQNSLLLRMSAMENANATSFRSVSSSVSASAIAGVLGIGSGGTGLSSAPTYGELLLGNSLGGYTLTATSSLGLPTFADITASISSASFGKSWEIASGALAPTTTLGVLVSASSTFSGGVSIDRATTTSATSTSLFSTLGRFTTGIMDAFTAVTGTITNLTSTTLVATNATTSSLFAGDLAASTARFGGTATSTFTSGGKLGIGVSSPTYHVDVAGFINTDQYSGYKQAGDTILYASSTNFATVNGISAGTKLQTLDTAIHNTAIGYQALNSASLTTTADYNTAVGSQALKANTTGAYNTAVGVALLGNTTGSYNSALGLNALTGNTTGSQNVALGNLALATATTSSNQTAVGYGALNSMITYSGNDTEGNVALGYNAGTSLTYGGANILIGFQAGDALTTGSNNIVLGYNIDAPDATANNQLVIGNTIFGLNVNSTGTTVDTDALIGIGTSTPYAKLSIINTGTGPSFVVEDSTSPDTTPFIIDTSGNVGIGTASPLSTLDVAGDAEIGGLSGSQSLFAYNSGRSSYGQLDLYNVSTGNVTLTTTFGSGNILLTPGATSGKVGIASTTPWRKFSVTGTVGFDGLTAGAGAGSLCLSANKEITYSDNAGCTGSSLRFKHDVATLTDGALDTVLFCAPASVVRLQRRHRGPGRTSRLHRGRSVQNRPAPRDARRLVDTEQRQICELHGDPCAGNAGDRLNHRRIQRRSDRMARFGDERPLARSHARNLHDAIGWDGGVCERRPARRDPGRNKRRRSNSRIGRLCWSAGKFARARGQLRGYCDDYHAVRNRAKRERSRSSRKRRRSRRRCERRG